MAPHQSTVTRPLQELKGFAKVELAPGESRSVEIALSPRAFAYWRSEGWCIEPGQYDIRIASSSAQVDASMTLTIVEDSQDSGDN